MSELNAGLKLIYQMFGDHAYLYWASVSGGVDLNNSQSLQDDLGFVGMIMLDGRPVRTVTCVVDRKTMDGLDDAILRGTVALPAVGCVLDAGHLLASQQKNTQPVRQVAGAR